jgi:hypothetical protein
VERFATDTAAEWSAESRKLERGVAAKQAVCVVDRKVSSAFAPPTFEPAVCLPFLVSSRAIVFASDRHLRSQISQPNTLTSFSSDNVQSVTGLGSKPN